MPITGLKTNLNGPTRASDTMLFIDASLTQFTEAFDTPSHLFLEIYTARFNEVVVAYKVDHEDGKSGLRVQRGMSGTQARSWPDDACVRVIEQVNGTVCAGTSTTTDGSQTDMTQQVLTSLMTKETLVSFLAALAVGEGLELDLTSADAPRLMLKSTGVRAGNYGGATVNRYGQITFAPDMWPASAVPAFDPCGCGPRGGFPPILG